MIFWISPLWIIYVTNLNVCWCLCNLSRLNSSSTSQSSVYIYKNEIHTPHLRAEQAINGKYLNHIEGDCAGTEETNGTAWWNISLPALANIFKINLMFRENMTRHYDYKVFINEEVVDIKKLAGMTPLYHEKDRDASSQFIMIFPVGIKGKQLVIYRNKKLEDDNPKNMLDICEVEIWGCIDQINEANCTCSQDKNFTFVKQESLTSVVAWPFQPNKVTLNCHQGNVTLQDYEDQCEFKPKCDLEYLNKSILFFCSACKEAIYDSDTTYDQNNRPFYTLSVGDNVTYTCKKGHRLTGGNLTRVCQENGSWSGEEPNCKPCTVAASIASTTDVHYFQPNDTLTVSDNVTYSCKYGHRLVSGNLIRVCQENGSLSGDEPIFKPCTEAAYNTTSTNAQYYRPINALEVGDNVTYTCKKDHRLVAGNLIRVCQENGSWSGEEPTCQRCKCPCKRLASQNFIKDPIVLQERVEETKNILKVNRSELSAFKRKKISSHDGRASSTGLGMTLGVGVITFVIGAIVCSDFLTCRRRTKKRGPRKTF